MDEIASGIPNDCKRVRLADHVSKIGCGFTPLGGHKSYRSSGVPLIRSQNVHMNRFEPDGVAFISEEQDAEMRASRVFEGDVLLNITGASIGRVCVVPREYSPANVNQHVCIIRTDGSLDSEYLAFYFANTEFQKFIHRSQAGATRQALTKAMVENFSVPFIALPEQQQIAALLRKQMTEVEKARSAVQSQIDAAAQLPDALLRAIFSSPPAQHWPRRKLGELLTDCRNGLYKPDSFYGQGTPILKMFNIGRLDGRWEMEKVDRIEATPEEQEQFGLRIGDIMFNRVNSRDLVGKCAVVDKATCGAVFESKNMRLRFDVKLANSKFVATFLNSRFGHSQIEKRTRQIIGMATVNRSDLASIEIPLPELGEQKKFMSRLEADLANAHSLRESLSDRLAEIELMPAALLGQAFKKAN